MSSMILIGMPASGKTTAGRYAAKLLSWCFVDTDALIEQAGGAPLCRLIEKRGKEGFMQLEEEVCAGLDAEGCILSTGGSVVYSGRAMAHLKRLGPVVYLKVSLETVKSRIPDFTSRGVVMRGDITTLDELYFERTPLYEKYADYAIDCEESTIEDTASLIAALHKENI